MGETSEITSTSSRDNRAYARHIAASAMEVPCPVISPCRDLDDRVARRQDRQTAMLVGAQVRAAGALRAPGRALGRCGAIYAKPSHPAPDVTPAASGVFAFFLEDLAALLAHHSQRALPSEAGAPHLPHWPSARRAAYCSRSLSRLISWQGSHTVPPSTGCCLPQRVHRPASLRARSRRLLLSLALLRHRSASLPAYSKPAALAFAWRARSALRRFSPQGRHKVRSGTGFALPHLGHMPRAARSAVMRS